MKHAFVVAVLLVVAVVAFQRMGGDPSPPASMLPPGFVPFDPGPLEESVDGGVGGDHRPALPSGSGSAGDPRGGEAQPLKVTGRVILGKKASVTARTKVGVVDLARCFAEIAEYQQIQRDKISKIKARYHFLLQKANERFLAAVGEEAGAQGLSVVLQRGGFEGGRSDQLVDLTDAIVARLRRDAT